MELKFFPRNSIESCSRRTGTKLNLYTEYSVLVGDVDNTPVKVWQWGEHQGSGPSFHNRLNDWNNGILSDSGLEIIHTLANYQQPFQVLDEYILFLQAYPEYADLIPVVRAFSKIHSIPITR